MQELENTLKEIDRRITVCSKERDKSKIVHAVWAELADLKNWIFDNVQKVNDGWIPVEDERLWDILFEEACIEGEQARRIYNRLIETFGGERSEMDGKI